MELTRLANAYHKEYKRLYRDYQNSQIMWAEWNSWASAQEPEYIAWLYENGLKLSDVQAKRPTSREWEWVDGAGLYHNRHLLWHELDQIRAKRSDCLRQIWFMLDENDEFVFSLADIAEILGETENNTQQIIKRHITWYQPRREFMSEHPSKGVA